MLHKYEKLELLNILHKYGELEFIHKKRLRWSKCETYGSNNVQTNQTFKVSCTPDDGEEEAKEDDQLEEKVKGQEGVVPGADCTRQPY